MAKKKKKRWDAEKHAVKENGFRSLVLLRSQGMSPCTMARLKVSVSIGWGWGGGCSNATDLQHVVAMANHQAETKKEHLS